MSTQKQDRPRRTSEKAAPRSAAPEVVYTQPKPFQRRRFTVQLLTVLAVVVAIFLGISVFFRVETVMVVGNEIVSADAIFEASGIKEGDSLIFFGEATAAGKILAAHTNIKKVSFDIKLPGKVTILVEEIAEEYAIKAYGGNWWLISSDGKLTRQIDRAQANDFTRIEGVEIKDPVAGQQAVAYEVQAGSDSDEPVTVMAEDRLHAALAVSKQLEANQILGKVAQMNVSDIYQLELLYGSSFRVKLGDSSRLDYKLAAVKQAVLQLENQTGVIDASFTSNPSEVIFTPDDQ